MAKPGQRKCLNCGELFDPDHRNKARQHYCCKAECRRASKAASQAAWLAKPQNSDYFRDPSHVARVRAWRAAHPGYSKERPKASTALQDRLPLQAVDIVNESEVRTEIPVVVALQDVLPPLNLIVTGLIAHLFEQTLQDDIDQTIGKLVQLGSDILNGSYHEDRQSAAAP